MIKKFRYKKQMSAITKAIERADDAQISQIIQAVVRRYGLVYPDWDVLFLSLPKEPNQRRIQLEFMLEHLKENHTL